MSPPGLCRRPILGVVLDDAPPEEALELIIRWATARERRYVCVSNVHELMEAHDDPEFRSVILSADLVISDSQVLCWANRALNGSANRRTLRGEEMMRQLCAVAADRGITVGFYGGTPQSLGRLKKELMAQFPSLDVGLALSPPFRQLSNEERDTHVAAINSADVALLFVGIGCPKQERWMAANTPRLRCTSIGVGSAFDFISGVNVPPPRWIHDVGLEWLYRLCTEPRRLWRRHLKHNPRFVALFVRELLRRLVAS